MIVSLARLVLHPGLRSMIRQERHLLLLSEHLDLLLLLGRHIWIEETEKSITLLTLVQGATATTSALLAEVRHLVRVTIVDLG